MHPFLSAVIGGALIGFSVVLLMFLSGRIAGISGIVGGLLPPKLGYAKSEETPLPCVTLVSTTSNLGLPKSVTSLGQSTSTLVLEGSLHRMTIQQRSAFFPEQSLLFPRR
jgi:hypothetical protein